MDWLEKMKFVSKLIFIFPLFAFANTNLAELNIDQGFKLINIDQKNVEIKGNHIYLKMFQRNKPVVVEFTKDFNGVECTINQTLKCSNGFKINLSTVNFEKPDYQISYKSKKSNKLYILHQLPIDFPKIKIIGQSTRLEDFIFSWSPKKINPSMQNEYSYLFVFSPSGDLKFFQRLPFTAVDFKSHFVNKKLYFSYLRSTATYPLVTIEGKRAIFDSQMNFIREFPELLDFHDFQLIDTNWYLGITYDISQNEFGKKYIQQKILEIKNGRKVFEWSIDDFMKANPFPNWKMKSQFRNQQVVHQYHLNHLQIIGDQIIVSLGFETIISLNKKTKKILWVFGGGSDQFGLTDELSTSLHHTPIFNPQNSTLTLFDNGISKRSSRVLQYNLDIQNKKIIKFKQLNMPASFSAMMGSVTEENQNYTVGFGTRDFGDYDILEIANNKINMSFRFDTQVSATYKIYRTKTNF